MQQGQSQKTGNEIHQIKLKYMKMYESVIEDVQAVEGTIKESETPEDFILDILGEYYKTFSAHEKSLDKIIEAAAANDQAFSEGEQAKMIQLKEFLHSFNDQFRDLEQSGFEEGAYQTFKMLTLQSIAALQQLTPQRTPPRAPANRSQQQQPPKPTQSQQQQPRQQPKPEPKPEPVRQTQPPPQQQPKPKPQARPEPAPAPRQNITDSRQPKDQKGGMQQSILQAGNYLQQGAQQLQQSAQQLQQSIIKQAPPELRNPMQQTTAQPQIQQSMYTTQQKVNALTGNPEQSSKAPLQQSNTGQLSQYQQQYPKQQVTMAKTGQFQKPTQAPPTRSPSPNQQLDNFNLNRSNNKGGEDFNEQFDQLSMSTMSVRDFPYKNQLLNDNKQYQGTLIPYDGYQFNEFHNIGLSDNQIRRLKVASLKSKSAIFESSQIQVGAITRLLFHELTNRYFLKVMLVVGNKTKQPMFSCKLSYEGDYTMSMWTQEPVLDMKGATYLKNDENRMDLGPTQQLSQTVVVHYNSLPYRPIVGNFAWQDDENQLTGHFVLPTLLTKFMSFVETEHIVFKQRWHYKKSQMMKSEVVQMNPKIVRQPIIFKKYFPQMLELSSLSDFVNQKQDAHGNYRDFKLGGTFTLQTQQIEFMLKIILRPNLTGIFKIIPFFSYQSQAEQILHHLVYVFALPN